MESELFSTQAVLTSLVSALSCACPLARAQEHHICPPGLLFFCSTYWKPRYGSLASLSFLLQRELQGTESCATGNAQCMSLLGALTPNEIAEHCFLKCFFAAGSDIKRRKMCYEVQRGCRMGSSDACSDRLGLSHQWGIKAKLFQTVELQSGTMLNHF